jgi:ribonuclease HIII
MIAGSDEAGKGDYFGYIVVACVCCKESILKEMSIRDSKSLSEKQIFRFEKKIKEKCVWKVFSLSPRRYNQLHKDTGGKYNLNQVLGWLHAKAIEEITKNCSPKRIIVDKFGKEDNVLRNLRKNIKKNIYFLTRGEEDAAVAAASILARAEFLRKHRYLSRKYGIEFPLGSAHVKEAAYRFIELYGKERLVEVAKVHFKITREL